MSGRWSCPVAVPETGPTAVLHAENSGTRRHGAAHGRAVSCAPKKAVKPIIGREIPDSLPVPSIRVKCRLGIPPRPKWMKRPRTMLYPRQRRFCPEPRGEGAATTSSSPHSPPSKKARAEAATRASSRPPAAEPPDSAARRYESRDRGVSRGGPPPLLPATAMTSGHRFRSFAVSQRPGQRPSSLGSLRRDAV